jgi:hypothetical protein
MQHADATCNPKLNSPTQGSQSSANSGMTLIPSSIGTVVTLVSSRGPEESSYVMHHGSPLFSSFPAVTAVPSRLPAACRMCHLVVEATPMRTAVLVPRWDGPIRVIPINRDRRPRSPSRNRRINQYQIHTSIGRNSGRTRTQGQRKGHRKQTRQAESEISDSVSRRSADGPCFPAHCRFSSGIVRTGHYCEQKPGNHTVRAAGIQRPASAGPGYFLVLYSFFGVQLRSRNQCRSVHMTSTVEVVLRDVWMMTVAMD